MKSPQIHHLIPCSLCVLCTTHVPDPRPPPAGAIANLKFPPPAGAIDR